MPTGRGSADAGRRRPASSTSPSARCAWIWRDQVALLLVVGVPLLAFALLAATFSNAVIRDLRVDVVDQDRSQTSMTFVQAISAAPGVTVARRSADLNGAMHAVRSGEAIAAVYIPREPRARHHAPGARPQIVDLLQQAVLHAGQRRLERAAGGGFGGRRRACRDVRRRVGFAPGPLWSSSNMCSPIRR